MATSDDASSRSWSTKIPVKLSLASHNISSPVAIKPLYLLAPRQGYLTTLGQQAWSYLHHVLPSVPGQNSTRPWFDYRGLPLRWNIPTGVLYDLLAEEGELPWPLTIHYTNFPESLTGWDNGATIQSQWLSALKEAAFVCRGPDGSSAIMRMAGSAQDELWANILRGDVGGYRKVLSTARIVPSERQGQPPNVPVRLFLRKATEGVLLMGDAFCTSRPVPARTAAGTWLSVADVLQLLLPRLFPPPTPPAATCATTTHTSPTVAGSITQTSGAEPSSVPLSSQEGSPVPATVVSGTQVLSQDVSETQMPLQDVPQEGPLCSAAAGADPLTTTAAAGTSVAAGAEADPSIEQSTDTAAGGEVGISGAAQIDETTFEASVCRQPSMGTSTSPDGAPVAASKAEPRTTDTLGSGTSGTPSDKRVSSLEPGPVMPSWDGWRIVVGGINAPLDTPVAWLHAALHAPDYFLYIVVRAC